MIELHNEVEKISVQQSQTLIDVAVPLNLISMFFSLSVVLIFIIFHSFKSHLVNRVSLRLTFAVAVVDLFYSGFQIVSDISQESGLLCALSVWGHIQTTHLSTFLTAMIAFNLQVIFVHGKRQTQAYEKYYFSVAGLLSLAISLPPLLGGRLGHDLYQESCWYNIYDASERMLWTWVTLYFWTMLGVFYCCIVVLLVVIKIARERRNRRKFFTSDSITIESTMNKVVRRVILYPIIPILTQSFNLISELDIYLNKRINYTFLLLSFIGTSSQGILNAIVFLVDPAIQNAWPDLKDDLIFHYHIRYEKLRSYSDNGECSLEDDYKYPKLASILNFVVRKILLSRKDAARLLQSDQCYAAINLRYSIVEPLEKAILHRPNRQAGQASSPIRYYEQDPKSLTFHCHKPSLDEGFPFSSIDSTQAEENVSVYFYQATKYQTIGDSQYICYM
ncbi:hypothetical protein K493DRAFT_296005 [Basidiobolus meristosporus CBS 931.73]|uniref:G-protein coupled receptors family 2 profile 2 domain-containing protein n=1 Tax=Basidiobolus meristosporus CBS 931.73 TaxID=1314790 RepID=A0A1Y1Z8D8_9FUNG|nr:hypothetical protein K493DRAFT_296005 [Basidiobolus meristosporus CBS 931.73]|eukprot:ORY06476.1 hypothetical protein K493DRAFT_296005 [Basidiobolus meristosporus CBS 931.73]